MNPTLLAKTTKSVPRRKIVKRTTGLVSWVFIEAEQLRHPPSGKEESSDISAVLFLHSTGPISVRSMPDRSHYYGETRSQPRSQNSGGRTGSSWEFTVSTRVLAIEGATELFKALVPSRVGRRIPNRI